jgi:hypothetical protein
VPMKKDDDKGMNGSSNGKRSSQDGEWARAERMERVEVEERKPPMGPLEVADRDPAITAELIDSGLCEKHG